MIILNLKKIKIIRFNQMKDLTDKNKINKKIQRNKYILRCITLIQQNLKIKMYTKINLKNILKEIGKDYMIKI